MRKGGRTLETKNKRVEDALFTLAVGYTSEEIREIVEEDATGKLKTKTERIRREIPPDLKAITEWLRNRCPEAWNESSEQPPIVQVISAIPRPHENNIENGGDSDAGYA